MPTAQLARRDHERDPLRQEAVGHKAEGSPGRAVEPMRVIEDIRDGMVSVEMAKSEYGVVAKMNGKGGLDAVELDAEATQRTRQEMRSAHAK